jgi:hypothetical protein
MCATNCVVQCTTSVSKYLLPFTFFYNFDYSSYKKIMQIPCILFVTCFTIVSILSLTYSFTFLQ